MEDAAFRRDRMQTAVIKLGDRLRELKAQEEDHRRWLAYEKVKAERDKLAVELKEVYPTLAARLPVQQLIEIRRPTAQLGSRLDVPIVFEGRLPRPQHLADRVSGHIEVPGNLLDRFALAEMLAPNSANRIHCQHSPTARFESKRAAHQAE